MLDSSGARGSMPSGIWYVRIPAGVGALIQLIVALLVTNVPKSRRYTEFWF